MRTWQSDIEKYGSKLLYDSITDDELAELFDRYNHVVDSDLNQFVATLSKYLDDQQLYRLCLKLIRLEVRTNAHDDGFMRNKSMAKLFVFELVIRTEFDKAVMALAASGADFLTSHFDIPPILAGVFKEAHATMVDANLAVNEDSFAEYFAFNIIKSIFIKGTEAWAQEDALEFMLGVSKAMNKNNKAYFVFLKNICQQIQGPNTLLPNVTKNSLALNDNAQALLGEVQLENGISLGRPSAFKKVTPDGDKPDWMQNVYDFEILNTYYSELQKTSVFHIQAFCDLMDKMLGTINALGATVNAHRFTPLIRHFCVKLLESARSKLESKVATQRVDTMLAKRLSHSKRDGFRTEITDSLKLVQSDNAARGSFCATMLPRA